MSFYEERIKQKNEEKKSMFKKYATIGGLGFVSVVALRFIAAASAFASVTNCGNAAKNAAIAGSNTSCG